MKSVNHTVRFPNDFRETVAILNVDPVVLIQRFIDQVSFYSVFRTMDLFEEFDRGYDIMTAMNKYQTTGKPGVGSELLDINTLNFMALSALKRESLSDKEETRKSIAIIRDWEKSIRTLSNYPKQVTLEGGGKLTLTFDFMLVYITCQSSINDLIREIMRRVSLPVLHAHQYSKSVHNNQKMMDFFKSLFDDQEGLFLRDSIAQAAIRLEYEPKFITLLKTMTDVKSYRKRVPMLRAFTHKWYGKLKEIN